MTMSSRTTGAAPRLGAALFHGDHGRLAEEVRRIEDAGLDFIHLDVFDGRLVPDLGFAPRTIAALRNRRLAGAGLDVFTHEPPLESSLLGLDRVVLTPHIGGQTGAGLRRMGEMIAENCVRVLRGESPLHQV